ncbi:thiol-disulfide oxidoreductase DCC family protein [Herbiconiux liangxiaofengii]|uniref:thiol-disulfide oxidoreductase DCC family protein n=1 Tax=Herbiconiux liangxiaofengii TaxID=3342795 RepID=UPI0035B851DA
MTPIRTEFTTGLVYDADCGFCTRAAEYLSRSGSVPTTSWQSLPDLAEVGLDIDKVLTAAYWLREGRATDAGASAIARALIAGGGWRAGLGAVILAPPVRWVAAPVYRVIARNRHAMPGGTAACRLPAT